jgi:hypothetical protein
MAPGLASLLLCVAAAMLGRTFFWRLRKNA